MGLAWWERSLGSSSSVWTLEIRACRGGRKSNWLGAGSGGSGGVGVREWVRRGRTVWRGEIEVAAAVVVGSVVVPGGGWGF